MRLNPNVDFLSGFQRVANVKAAGTSSACLNARTISFFEHEIHPDSKADLKLTGLF